MKNLTLVAGYICFAFAVLQCDNMGNKMSDTCVSVTDKEGCYFIGEFNQSCNDICATRGGFNASGSSFTAEGCRSLLDKFLPPQNKSCATFMDSPGNTGIGCGYTPNPTPTCTRQTAAFADVKFSGYMLICACNTGE